MDSVDFAEIEPLQHDGRWNEAAERMIEAAQHLEAGGADFIVLCTNTMHKTACNIERHVGITLLHIADATPEQVKAEAFSRVGLLGTWFTMEDNLFKGRLNEKHGIEVVIPSEGDRLDVHQTIYDEAAVEYALAE
jgi:aspartate racemase